MRKLTNLFSVLMFVFIPPLFAQDGGVIFSPGGGPPGQPDPIPLGDQIPALCRIHFLFSDDDHHVLHMRAQPSTSGEFFHFEFHDNDSDRNNYYGPFEWWDFGDRPWDDPEQFTTDEQECSGRCTLFIPPIPPDREFGLTGFDFEFRDGDHHLRDVMIVPRPRLGRIIVNFRDNSTPPYLVRISYVTFEKGNWRRTRSLTEDRETSEVLREANRGIKVLQGFRARFLNGDHHLKEFEIDVCGDSWLNGIFRDSGSTDDPFRLDVWYSYL